MPRPWSAESLDRTVMKTKLIYLLGLTLLFAVVIGYLVQKQSSDNHRDVVLRVSTPQPTNAVMQDFTNVLTFEILNNGRSPIVCPDIWLLLFDDGRVQKLSLPRSGNIWVQPGKVGTLAITNPATTRAWRLAANYYCEDYVCAVKFKIGQSALRNYLPRSFIAVRGQNVMSDWIR